MGSGDDRRIGKKRKYVNECGAKSGGDGVYKECRNNRKNRRGVRKRNSGRNDKWRSVRGI